MTESCPNCGTLNAMNHRFCSNCGTALSTPVSQDGAGRMSPPNPGTQQGGSTVPIDTFPSTAYVVKKADAPESVSYTPEAGAAPAGPSSFYESAAARTQPYVQQPAAPSAQGFQSYTPGAPARPGATVRQDTASYVPYAAPTAGSLDKPKEQRSWLVPVIIGAAVVLLGLVLLSAYLVVSGRSGSSAAGSPSAPSGGPAIQGNGMAQPSPTQLPANASDEDKLRHVIYTSNENQIKSWKDLDTAILKKSYIGQALDDNVKQVQDLEQRGMYALPVNQKLEIVDVKANGDTALAHTQEVWTVTYYSKADNKQINSQSYSLTETYHFVKQNGTWFIDKLDINDTTPTPGSNG